MGYETYRQIYGQGFQLRRRRAARTYGPARTERGIKRIARRRPRATVVTRRGVAGLAPYSSCAHDGNMAKQSQTAGRHIRGRTGASQAGRGGRPMKSYTSRASGVSLSTGRIRWKYALRPAAVSGTVA